MSYLGEHLCQVVLKSPTQDMLYCYSQDKKGVTEWWNDGMMEWNMKMPVRRNENA